MLSNCLLYILCPEHCDEFSASGASLQCLCGGTKTYSDTELISSRPGAVEEISLPGLYLVFRAWLLLCPNSLLHTIPSCISLLLACIQRSFLWQVI